MTLFELMLQATLMVSCLALGAFLISRLMGKSMAAKYKRWIWLILAVRLLLPIDMSINQAPVTVPMPNLQRPVYTAPVATGGSQPQSGAARTVAGDRTGSSALATPSQSSLSVLQVLSLIWIAGVVGVAVWEIAGHMHARRKILRWSRAPETQTREMLDTLAGEMGIRGTVPLRLSAIVKSPMMVGLLRPVMVLPNRPYDEEDLSLILRHELTHYRRGDLWYKFLLMAARTVHWFNPLVHLMFWRADVDMELACDDAVVRMIGAGQTRRYGETILSAACVGRGYSAPVSTHFQSGKKNLANRIINMMQTKKRRIGVVAFALVMVVALAGGMLVSFASTAGTGTLQTADTIRDTYGLLLGLRTEDYEGMTVQAFREMVHERMAEDEAAYLTLYDLHDEEALKLRYTDNGASFIFNTLIPLTAERWQSWRYQNYVPSANPDQMEVEYTLLRTVLDAGQLTVGETERALSAMMEGIAALTLEHLYGETADEAAFRAGLASLEARYSNDAMQLSVADVFIPEVGMTGVTDQASGEMIPDAATREDYELLLALKVDGFADMTVAAFNAHIQDAFREEGPIQDAYERVYNELLQGIVPDYLTEAEETFLRVTLDWTIREYVAENQSQYSDEPVLPTHQGYYFGDGSEKYGVAIEYVFEHELLNAEALTVTQRDERLQAVVAGMDQALLDGIWYEGQEIVKAELELLCDDNSIGGILKITPGKLYYDVDTIERSEIAEKAYALIDEMSKIDTSLTVEEYERRVAAICDEAGMSLYEIMADASGVMDVENPLYQYHVLTLMHTSSEMFARQMGGEERSFASDWVKRDKYESILDGLEEMQWSEEELEAFLAEVDTEEPVIVYLVQANYILVYDIADPAAFTVDEREERIRLAKEDMRAYMDSLTEEQLRDPALEDGLRAELARISAKHSDARMTIEGELQMIDRIGFDED